jgi:hypothetical protein
MLRRDDRFVRLRRELRQGLCFDRDLFRLAMRTRSYGWAEGLRGSRLIEVWQHVDHLKVVEKDAPRLLPLAYSLIDKIVDRPACEAVKALKELLLPLGLTDAGWRYLLKHDIYAISETGGGRLTVEELARLAQALAMAGGHPPPSAALREAIRPRFAAIRQHGTDHQDGILKWLTEERRLASALLKAANEAKRSPDYGRFIDDAMTVLWWLRDARIEAPRKSLRTLIRLASAWEADQLAIAQTGRRRWSKPRSVPCADGVHEAVLLDGPVAVLEEARAMRNCLRHRLAVLSSRKAQIWSVRTQATGERVALVELRRDGDRWARGQIAARFNRPAPAWVVHFVSLKQPFEVLDSERLVIQMGKELSARRKAWIDPSCAVASWPSWLPTLLAIRASCRLTT